jgi:COMPASS component SWD3
LHAFKGYKNKNWPIKCSFYKFKENTALGMLNGPSAEDIYVEPRGDSDKAYDYQTLLATGSADPYLYVYNITTDVIISLLRVLLHSYKD